MPEVCHPCALDEVPGVVPSDVKVAGDVYDVADDGTVALPDDRAVASLASAYDLAPSDLNQQADTRDPEALVKDGICPWCDDYEGDHVGQHASSAHPEEWSDYRGD